MKFIIYLFLCVCVPITFVDSGVIIDKSKSGVPHTRQTGNEHTETEETDKETKQPPTVDTGTDQGTIQEYVEKLSDVKTISKTTIQLITEICQRLTRTLTDLLPMIIVTTYLIYVYTSVENK